MGFGYGQWPGPWAGFQWRPSGWNPCGSCQLPASCLGPKVAKGSRISGASVVSPRPYCSWLPGVAKTLKVRSPMMRLCRRQAAAVSWPSMRTPLKPARLPPQPPKPTLNAAFLPADAALPLETDQRLWPVASGQSHAPRHNPSHPPRSIVACAPSSTILPGHYGCAFGLGFP